MWTLQQWRKCISLSLLCLHRYFEYIYKVEIMIHKVIPFLTYTNTGTQTEHSPIYIHIHTSRLATIATREDYILTSNVKWLLFPSFSLAFLLVFCRLAIMNCLSYNFNAVLICTYRMKHHFVCFWYIYWTIYSFERLLNLCIFNWITYAFVV